MIHRQNRRVHPIVLAAAAGAALASASVASAQSSWAGVVSDSWFNAARWAPAGIPNSSGTNVTLGLAGAYTVSMQNATATCGTLTLTNSAAVLNIFDNSGLNVSGNISNSGLIQICGPGAAGNLTHFDANAANVTFSGSGTLRLAALNNGDNDSAYLYYNGVNTRTMTNAAGHTVAGDGRVYVNFINNGTVNADTSGKYLMMIEQPKTNNATMTASGGGALQFRSVSLTQGAGGVCLSSNSSPVQIVNTTVSGGTLNGAGTGPGVQYFGNNTLDSVTLSNLNAITDNSNVNVTAGGVVNNGTWTISDPAAAGNLTRITTAAAAVTIGGTGTIRLQGVTSGNGDNTSAYLDYAAAANVLTVGPSQSIKGYGRVYTALTNNGSVNADISGKGIFMIDQPKTNNGTMTASNGGFLQFRSVTVTGVPAAQIISTDSASPVQMVGATMTGGGFTTAGTGRFDYYGANTLSNLTVNGTHQITDNSSAVLNTDLVNNGNWLISTPTAPGNLTRMTANAAAVNISGTGTIRLQGVQTGAGDNDSAYIYYGAAANVLTLGANQQLLGYGRVYTNLVNNGIINADNTPNASGPASKGIYLQEQPKTNNTTITSSNGGYWYVRNTTMTNNGTLSSSNTTTSGGAFENSTVTGGTISNVSNQAFGTAGTVVINGSTLSSGSVLQVNDNSILNTSGLTNNGTILISTPAAPGNLTRLQASAATTTLSGSGTLRLQAAGGNGDNDSAYLYYNGSSGNQLVNSATHSIKGYGRVYTNIVNNGLIEADQSGKGLYLLQEPKTNNATITSSNSGYWYVRGCTVTNGPAGVLGSTNTLTSGGGLENCTIVGGQLTNILGQSFATAGTVSFDGVTITPGTGVLVNDNTILAPAAGGIVNNGTIYIQRVGGPGNLTRMASGIATTISGTGTIRLQATGLNNDSAYIQASGGPANPITIGAGQTLSGAGRVYGSVVMNGAIAPDQPFGTPGPCSRIDVMGGTTTLTASGSYNAQLASTSSYDQVGGNGTIAISGTLNVGLVGVFSPPVGSTYDIISGPTVTGTFSTVNLPTLSSGHIWFITYGPNYVRLYATCYGNCDGSSTAPVLNANDFNCFLNKFAAGDGYANCDGSSVAPTLNANDFNCFLNSYAAGCN